MYKRKKYESSKNKGHSKALKYIPYWTRIHVTNSLFLPWFSGSFTIEIFNQRDVSSVKTDTFNSQTFPDAYQKKEEGGGGGSSNYVERLSKGELQEFFIFHEYLSISLKVTR